MINSQLKIYILEILRIKFFNALIKKIIELLYNLYPSHHILQFPIIGKIKVKLENNRTITIFSNGYDIIANSLFWNGLKGYESDTISLFLKLSKHSNTFFDVGANTGLYSLLAGISNPDCMIYSFEPVPEIYESLKKNIKINNFKNIKPENLAVYDKDGSFNLFIPYSPWLPVSASLLKDFGKSSRIINVNTIKVDSYVKCNKIDQIDLIKIDTEGIEPLVLKGGIEMIKRDFPIIICEVLKGKTELEIHNLLDNLSYEYFWITEKGLIKKDKIEGHQGKEGHLGKNLNYLFITSEKKKLLKKIGFL